MKWVYYRSNDELRGWNPCSSKPVATIISDGDIEILIDENGDIQEIIIGNASKKISIDEIEEIAEVVDKHIEIPPPEKKRVYVTPP
ncbi:MAG: hypothetical protein J7K21_05635 [Desulfurococcales archaeon]|nr:hypothetical protein [Desulfurococcales archaeon]